MRAITWTRSSLEEVLTLMGKEEHQEFADRHGITYNTVYSLKGRIRDYGGVDEFLEDQSHRYQSYVKGGTATRTPNRKRLKNVTELTLEEQLAKPRRITVAGAGRARTSTQYTLTIPKALGEIFVKEYGPFVLFKQTSEGILIVPIQEHSET